MSWEQRGKRRVYYRARRVNGRVQKEYLGHGPQAEAAAAKDAAAREARRREREAIQEIKEQAAPLTEVMAVLDKVVTEMTAGSLLAAGYHQHRGAWRRRRGKPK